MTNRKKEKAKERLKSINEGNEVSNVKDFENAKTSLSSSNYAKSMSNLLKDNDFYVSKMPQEKHYAKEKNQPTPLGTTAFRNSAFCPDWFYVRERPENQILPEKSPTFNGTLTYLSKAQGWITVTPRNKNRNKPLEKERIVTSNICIF